MKERDTELCPAMSVLPYANRVPKECGDETCESTPPEVCRILLVVLCRRNQRVIAAFRVDNLYRQEACSRGRERSAVDFKLIRGAALQLDDLVQVEEGGR